MYYPCSKNKDTWSAQFESYQVKYRSSKRSDCSHKSDLIRIYPFFPLDRVIKCIAKCKASLYKFEHTKYSTFFGISEPAKHFYGTIIKFSERHAQANSIDPDQTAPVGSTLLSIPSASFREISLVWTFVQSNG